MRPSALAGSLIISLSLALALLVGPGCGNKNPSKSKIGDEQLIQESIDAWLKLLDVGNESGLEELFDPAAWGSSRTKSEWAKFTGKKPSAGDVSIVVSGDTATAAFVVTTNEQEQTHVSWTLRKVGSVWEITGEEWS
jgi:hypothetical protein